MNRIFKNLVWSLELPPPWQIQEANGGIEITQPEGTGVMQITSARKKEGVVTEADILESLKRYCPSDTAREKVRCGDFVGYAGFFVDWATSRSWRIWLVACGMDLLRITYTCWRGEEQLEADDASALLRSLRSRAAEEPTR